MQVGHGLAAVGSVVDDQAIAVSFRPSCSASVAALSSNCPKKRLVSLRGLRQPGNGFLGHEQDVGGAWG